MGASAFLYLDAIGLGVVFSGNRHADLIASEDGGVHQIIEPNETWSAQYRVNQRACTNWYHPHLMGKTAEHVYKGLAGLIIVEDDNTLDLPKTYGVDDIPLIIQDRQFTSSKQLDYSPEMRDIMHGYRGDILLTNGQIEPKITLDAGVIRFRILNGSNAGLYKFSLSDGRDFYQIATDNGFLQKSVAMKSLLLSPGERAEILIDFSADTEKSLYLQVKESIDNRTFKALAFHVTTQSSAVQTLPTELIEHESIDITQVVRTRNFTLEGSGNRGNPKLTINNKEMDMNRIDETIKLNELEIWHIKNTMDMDHNFHIHATHFIPYKRDGSEAKVKENERGYKDCMHIPPNGSIDILVKMTDYAAKGGAYMYHCHFLEHEDAGMMGQFEVVEA